MHLGTVIGSQVNRLCPLTAGRKRHSHRNGDISIFLASDFSTWLGFNLKRLCHRDVPIQRQAFKRLISLVLPFCGKLLPEEEFWVNLCKNKPGVCCQQRWSHNQIYVKLYT